MAHSKKKDLPAAQDAAPSTPQEAALSDKRRPQRTLRADDCSASIWARDYLVQGKPKTFFTVTLERSYKDRDGAWKYTKSFDADSLGKVVTLCQQASEAIADLQNAAAESHAQQEKPAR